MNKAYFYRDAVPDSTGPLHGIRLLDVTTAWAGPMAACIFADLGADVIRVEMPGNKASRLPPPIPGTGLSLFHETVQRNKRSIGIDLRREAGREIFLKLVTTADIVLESFRPGTMDGWGVGHDECRKVRPGIVFVSISGWGQYGPDAHRGAYDPVIQAASGWMSLNGSPDGEPTRAATYLADDLAALHAVIGALAALRHRDKKGEGQHVDVSMLDAVLFQSNGLLTLAKTAGLARRWGNEVDVVAPSNAYACLDGYVYLTVALDKHWRRLVGQMGRPELARAAGFATNAERRHNRAAVNAAVASWCAGLRVRQVVSALEPHGIAVSEVRSLTDAAADPHVLERDMLQRTVLSSGESAPLTGPAVKFSRTPTRVRSAAPAPGADTDAILAEAGIGRAGRTALGSRGAV